MCVSPDSLRAAEKIEYRFGATLLRRAVLFSLELELPAFQA